MSYRIVLILPCGTRHLARSLPEATLMVSLGWRFIALRGSGAGLRAA